MLPTLDQNIRCGNSLIGTDILADGSLDQDAIRAINPFDWNCGLAEIMEAGGFDVVVGNPPYVRQELLKGVKEYFSTHYATFQGTADLYVFFIERGVSLLREGGYFSYIVANKWMRAAYGKPLRKWLKEQQIEEIIDFGDLPVFTQATTYPCILRMSKRRQDDHIRVVNVENLEFSSLEQYVQDNGFVLNQQGLDESGWALVDEEEKRLLDKIRSVGVPLGEYIGGKLYRGILTGLNKAFVVDEEVKERLIAEDLKSVELIKPFLAGRDIKRYQTLHQGKYLILIPKGWTREKSGSASNKWKWFQDTYPAIAGHLQPFREEAEKRDDQGEYWWELRACDYYDDFQKPKIIIPAIVKKASYGYDSEGTFYSNDKTSIIPTDDCYLLGILNSKVSDYYLHSIASTKQGGYYEYKPMYVSQIPIHSINSNNSIYHDQIVTHVTRILDLHKQLATARLPQDKDLIQRQIDATDKAIDTLVYDLYGLTEEERKIIEESV